MVSTSRKLVKKLGKTRFKIPLGKYLEPVQDSILFITLYFTCDRWKEDANNEGE
jgi:hypothetical protein